MRFVDESNENDTFMRGVKNEDGNEFWSVYDFLNVVFCQKINDEMGQDEFLKFTSERNENHATVMQLVTYNKISSMDFSFFLLCLFLLLICYVGDQGAITPTMTLSGLKKLISVLVYPAMSDGIAELLNLVDTTLAKAIDGDRSMILGGGPSSSLKRRLHELELEDTTPAAVHKKYRVEGLKYYNTQNMVPPQNFQRLVLQAMGTKEPPFDAILEYVSERL